jgi:hypothetical protein
VGIADQQCGMSKSAGIPVIDVIPPAIVTSIAMVAVVYWREIVSGPEPILVHESAVRPEQIAEEVFLSSFRFPDRRRQIVPEVSV